MNVSIENHSLALVVVVVCGGGVVYTAFTAAVLLCVEVDLRPQLRQFTITTPL